MAALGVATASLPLKTFRLTAKVTPSGGRASIESVDVSPGGDIFVRLRVNAPPEKGKANQAVIQILATFFHIAPRSICLLHGHTHRTKILEIQADREDALERLQAAAPIFPKKSGPQHTP